MHPNTDPHPVEQTLARLGVMELEERLEHAPLLTGGVEPAAECCSNFCNCTVQLPEIIDGKPLVR